MHDDQESRALELKALLQEKLDLESSRSESSSALAAAQDQLAELREQLATLRIQAETDRAQLESSRLAEAAAARDDLSRQLEAATQQLHDMTTDRNRCKKLADSIQTDMKRMYALGSSKPL
jgi:chromosome segregation ATPase